MKAAKITIVAPVASFRYPHFLVGKQVSYAMPPPSTIYGHVCSAAGQWLDPASLSMAYNFTFESQANDLEHQHIISTRPPDKLSQEQSANFKKWRFSNPLAVGGSVQPTLREFLFDAVLTLYLIPASLGAAFVSPVFPVVLGRSQDLASIISVQEVGLVSADGAYFESTLLPFSWRAKTYLGITILMSRYISPPPERDAEFAQYIALRGGERAFGGTADLASNDRRLMVRSIEAEEWLVDPSTPSHNGVQRGVIFHSFVD